MAKDPHDNKELPNVKMLANIRIKGKLAVTGSVVSKSDFPNKSDWQNLCNMDPARCTETDDEVGEPDEQQEAVTTKGGKKTKGSMPGV